MRYFGSNNTYRRNGDDVHFLKDDKRRKILLVGKKSSSPLFHVLKPAKKVNYNKYI